MGVRRRSSLANISDGRQRLVAVTTPHAATSNPPSTSAAVLAPPANSVPTSASQTVATLNASRRARRIRRQHRAARQVARGVVPDVVERMAGGEARDEPDPAQREDHDRGLQGERDDDEA